VEPIASLPLPVAELPEALRRFGDPAAPAAARTMAAKGLLPLKGGDLVTVLCQLSADADAVIAQTAHDTLRALPPEVTIGACDASLHAAVLDRLADVFAGDERMLERIAENHATADATVLRIARGASEHLGEVIAQNQQRLLGAPAIIEALYKNKRVLMSTADRLVELAARHGLDLTGIPAFKAHLEALQGELIPEPEPGVILPADQDFKEAIELDEDDPEAVEVDAVDGKEDVKKKFVPLQQRVLTMSTKEKIRLALVGDAAARALLVRDKSNAVARAAITSPMMTETEATAIARSKEVSEDIIRYVSMKREWLRNYELKRALLYNPKTPLGVAMGLLSHMQTTDLRDLSRSRNVPATLKTAALQRFNAKQKRGA
jgi:hypothetical protein